MTNGYTLRALRERALQISDNIEENERKERLKTYMTELAKTRQNTVDVYESFLGEIDWVFNHCINDVSKLPFMGELESMISDWRKEMMR